MSEVLLGIAAILTPLSVIIGHLLARSDRQKKANVSSQENAQIHVLVNSRLTEALQRIEVFEKHLGLPPGADPDS